MAAAAFWTNESVLGFAGDLDPIEAVTRRAREFVYSALEKGWRGPPYDPFALAELLRVRVIPRDDRYDARIVVVRGRPQIEYNPTRPRGRVRFSVAHELAHTFFPDFADFVRYRKAEKGAPGDEWQLELLCNMAAAELLMPIGSFRELMHEPLGIERLMELRKQFDVSAEALLLRVAKLTDRRTAAFAAARIDGNRASSPFRLDYVVGSRSWAHHLRRGRRIPSTSVLADCSAAGFTAKGREAWSQSAGELEIECVGIAPYPGARFPRVAGLLLAGTEHAVSREITEVLGDATQPGGEGPAPNCSSCER